MTEHRSEIATLAGGCFWCLEAVFEQLEGVERVESGYSGGTRPKPTYEQVCTGASGHAEVVQVTFDPVRVSYRDVLEIFFAFHDPTTLNRQGPDAGTQYRSAIFHHSLEQRATAEQVIAELTEARSFDDSIVTVLEPFTAFYKAEGYHQGYFRQNSSQPYCRAIVAPKVAKLREQYLSRLKPVVPTGSEQRTKDH